MRLARGAGDGVVVVDALVRDVFAGGHELPLQRVTTELEECLLITGLSCFIKNRTDRKSQVRHCLGFCSAGS